jgi:hypothetical protein
VWRLTIGGVDKTAIIDAFSLSLTLNDRAGAQVVIADELPDRYAELVSYAADGVTPLFGGIILQRSFQGRTQAAATFTASLDCGDWFTYADWVYTTSGYADGVSLRAVLNYLVTTHLHVYGITLDPTQVEGPTLAGFNWDTKRVSDALRELSDRTGYVVRISPGKALRMFQPMTIAAPFSLTETATNCRDVTWRDSDRTPYNTVVLRCGPGGLAEVSNEQHYGDGSRRRWPLNAPFHQIIGGLITGSDAAGDDPGGYEVGIVGDPESGDRVWTVDLATNEVVQRADQPVRASGEYFRIWYTGAFPFIVRVTSGATIPVEYAESRPDVLSIPVATEIANQLLASFQAAPRELQITTDVDGLDPGQALTVDLPTIRSISGSFLVTRVAMQITLDINGGARLWQYSVEAIESTLYQGSWLDDWRKIAGIGGGGASTITGGGDGGGGTAPASPIYLGGSRQFALEPATATWLPVPEYVPFVAPASFAGQVRADIYARRPGVGAQARLFNVTDGTTVALSAVVTSTAPGAAPPFDVAITAGKTYRLEGISTVDGEGVFVIGVLEQ